MDHTVSGLNYDLDGNILAKKQRSVEPGGNVTNIATELCVRERWAEQQAQSVGDAQPVNNFNLGDFQNHHTGGDDYTYDANGNLTQD